MPLRFRWRRTHPEAARRDPEQGERQRLGLKRSLFSEKLLTLSASLINRSKGTSPVGEPRSTSRNPCVCRGSRSRKVAVRLLVAVMAAAKRRARIRCRWPGQGRAGHPPALCGSDGGRPGEGRGYRDRRSRERVWALPVRQRESLPAVQTAKGVGGGRPDGIRGWCWCWRCRPGVVGLVVVAVSRAAVPGVVVPGAATQQLHGPPAFRVDPLHGRGPRTAVVAGARYGGGPYGHSSCAGWGGHGAWRR
jgi:hypothetical protein